MGTIQRPVGPIYIPTKDTSFKAPTKISELNPNVQNTIKNVNIIIIQVNLVLILKK